MKDYKEIVEELRNACEGCNSSAPPCKRHTSIQDAADAIEELVDKLTLAISDLEIAKVCDTCAHVEEQCDDGCKYKWRG